MDNSHELKIFSQGYMGFTMSVEILWTSCDLPTEPVAILMLNCKLLFSTISDMIKCYCPSHCGSLHSESLGRYQHLLH